MAYNVPAGLGAPVFDKLEAELASACMSLPASKGFEIGSGFGGTLLHAAQGSSRSRLGVAHNPGARGRASNRSGASRAASRMERRVWVRVAFKPTSTIGQLQNTVTRDARRRNYGQGPPRTPCVLPRAAPMVESMVAPADALMQQKAQCDLLEFRPPEPRAARAAGAEGGRRRGALRLLELALL